jgi:hypothetical protein
MEPRALDLYVALPNGAGHGVFLTARSEEIDTGVTTVM